VSDLPVPLFEEVVDSSGASVGVTDIRPWT
jgi:hypothetical protein